MLMELKVDVHGWTSESKVVTQQAREELHLVAWKDKATNKTKCGIDIGGKLVKCIIIKTHGGQCF